MRVRRRSWGSLRGSIVSIREVYTLSLDLFCAGTERSGIEAAEGEGREMPGDDISEWLEVVQQEPINEISKKYMMEKMALLELRLMGSEMVHLWKKKEMLNLAMEELFSRSYEVVRNGIGTLNRLVDSTKPKYIELVVIFSLNVSNCATAEMPGLKFGLQKPGREWTKTYKA